MIVTRGSVAKQLKKAEDQSSTKALELADPVHFGKILKDIDYARSFAAKTLEEMFVL